MDMARFGDPAAVGDQRVLSSILDILSDAKDKAVPDRERDSGKFPEPSLMIFSFYGRFLLDISSNAHT